MLKKFMKLFMCAAMLTTLPSCKSGTSPQLSEIKKGEEIAVMETSMGVIKLRFFPEYAPKAVENFITHAKNGYYDGVIFHRVINEFMIQTGDPTGTGGGGESIWGEPFGVEISPELHHIRGAVGTAKTNQPISIGSQFYIVQNTGLDSQSLTLYQDALDNPDEVIGQDENGKDVTVKDYYPTDILEAYIKDGGAPHLDFEYTVFAQVVEGMDVVDKIGSVATSTDPATADKPLEDVWIVGITFETH